MEGLSEKKIFLLSRLIVRIFKRSCVFLNILDRSRMAEEAFDPEWDFIPREQIVVRDSTRDRSRKQIEKEKGFPGFWHVAIFQMKG